MKESLYEALQKTFIKYNNLKVGDKVKVLRSAVNKEQGWDGIWTDSMDSLIGRTLQFRSVIRIDKGLALQTFEVPRVCYGLPFFVLEKVEEPDDIRVYNENSRLDALVCKESDDDPEPIRIYRGRLSFETFDKIAEAVAKVRPPKKRPLYFEDVPIGYTFRCLKGIVVFLKTGDNTYRVAKFCNDSTLTKWQFPELEVVLIP